MEGFSSSVGGGEKTLLVKEGKRELRKEGSGSGEGEAEGLGFAAREKGWVRESFSERPGLGKMEVASERGFFWRTDGFCGSLKVGG